ncbi:hypothetical protein FSP39_006214 [Pinctada imbricata]|uniref:Uncharacterized protein n=1 Tax=Pinctada imbricata TaxID=66713 RepID=A0AA88YBE8_PINIB|nr:hypothetical protein FSP39_006214 [Pinctada imbricata]
MCSQLEITADDCGVSGKWMNQLNSTMEICCVDGNLYGKYNSAVGKAEDFYVLRGRYTLHGDDCILGWSVAFNNTAFGNSYSTASWSGIHYADEEIIYTQWLLASFQSRESFWKAFNTNQDVFHRIC